MTITVQSLIAALCWLIGFGLAILDVLLPSYSLTALALGFIAVGATVTVRKHVSKVEESWAHAYEIGASDRVRNIR